MITEEVGGKGEPQDWEVQVIEGERNTLPWATKWSPKIVKETKKALSDECILELDALEADALRPAALLVGCMLQHAPSSRLAGSGASTPTHLE
ncbi:hypothetical protein ACFL59_08690 [Planctomycetota bacterium]